MDAQLYIIREFKLGKEAILTHLKKQSINKGVSFRVFERYV